MDVQMVRAVMTVVLLAVFIGIVVWAWSGGRRADFDAAARLPLDEDDADQRAERGHR
jgi:cytochrome c oxidase cbb3-type subunit 4